MDNGRNAGIQAIAERERNKEKQRPKRGNFCRSDDARYVRTAADRWQSTAESRQTANPITNLELSRRARRQKRKSEKVIAGVEGVCAA